MSKNDELKRLAEAATAGPWSMCGEADGSQGFEIIQDIWNEHGTHTGKDVVVYEWSDESDPLGVIHRADAEFIAAANPVAVLALIADSNRLESEAVYAAAGFNAAREEIAKIHAEVAGLRTGYEAYERVNAELKAEVEGLRATADLQKLLPEVSDALEELELHGLHSDQGYRKLKDWHRKVGLAYRVIQGPMFGAEHGELVSQNTWLRSVVEHYAQQHAPLEPLPDMEGWSARLPGYDLPSLLRDAERYRRARDIACRVRASVGFHLVVQLPSPSGSSFCAAKAFDEAIDAALGQGEQS